MKENIYKTQATRYFLKSSLTWFCLMVQLGLSIYFLCNYSDSGLVATIILNLIFSFVLTIPGLVIHFNYLKHCKNAKFIIRLNSVEFVKKNNRIILKSNEIVKIIHHTSPINSRFPWWHYNWFELIDSYDNRICVNFYMLDISTLWQDPLSSKINSDKYERKENYFPLIK